jgi:hypothetical protein
LKVLAWAQGDTLTIGDVGTGHVYLALNSSNAVTGKYVFNSSNLQIIFSSNSDGVNGSGFAILYKRIFPASLSNSPVSGYAGNALFFDAQKGALRTGSLANPTDTIGISSVAFGNSIAPGDYSTAFGTSSAIDERTIAGGSSSTAKGFGSVAMGNVATANGNGAVSMGAGTSATGNGATAFGNGSASGDNATAIGNSHATGTAALALGQATASADYSSAIGSGSAGGVSSVAMGGGSASGNNAIAIGSANATGDNSTAMGELTHAGGQVSTAMGYSTSAAGQVSLATGNATSASGNYSTAMGYTTTASGNYSTAIGTYVSTSGFDGAYAIGDHSTTTTMNSFVANGYRARFAGGYRLFTENTATVGAALLPSANAWSTLSDRRRKENFEPVDGESFLKKIAAMPLTTWNYIGQDSHDLRHYGPMAQDFFEAFGKDKYGTIGCDTLINQADFMGVTFIATQALVKRTDELQKENDRLKKILLQMQGELDRLNKKISAKKSKPVAKR